MHITRLNLDQIFMQHLWHWWPTDIGTLRSYTASVQIATGMLAVADIHITDNIHDTAVGFLRQTLIKTTVSRLHMENRNMQTFRTDHAQARVGIP